jgi:hypothetical protein
MRYDNYLNDHALANRIGAPNSAARFAAIYEVELRRCLFEHPDQYAYTSDEVAAVAGRMMDACHFRTANVNSPAFKATCKYMGIKHTQATIFSLMKDRFVK